MSAKLTGLNVFDLTAPNVASPKGSYSIRTRGYKPTVKCLQNIYLANKKKKQKTDPLTIKKVIPSKREIFRYCMQDEIFRENYTFWKSGGKGSSAAGTRAELRKTELLKTLPFGSIIKEQE